MAKLTVHHLDNSRSHRILWLLEELGVDYDIREYKRGKDMRAPASLREVHPLGKAPVVTMEDGRVLAESAAIIETLVEEFGPELAPEDGEARRRYRYFMHYAEGSLMPPLLVKLITSQLRNAPVPFFIKPIPRAIAKQVDDAFTDAEITRNLTFLNDELSDRTWIAGDAFTAADIQLSFPLEGAESRVGFDDYPHVRAYVDRFRERPAYIAAEERGGALTLGQM